MMGKKKLQLTAQRTLADTRRTSSPHVTAAATTAQRRDPRPDPTARWRRRGWLFPVVNADITCEVCGMSPDEKCGVCK
jgi:hypothetical protein